MGRHGFPGIPRRFGMQLPLVAMVLREASALMRISSNYYTVVFPHRVCVCVPVRSFCRHVHLDFEI